MKLTVFNGSPRGKESNTGVLLEHFLNGFIETQGNTYKLAYLIRVRERNNFVEMFQQAEQALLGFQRPHHQEPHPVHEKGGGRIHKEIDRQEEPGSNTCRSHQTG